MKIGTWLMDDERWILVPAEGPFVTPRLDSMRIESLPLDIERRQDWKSGLAKGTGSRLGSSRDSFGTGAANASCRPWLP